LILIAHSFGIVAKPKDIFNLGIDNIGDLDLNYAREKNLKIKLVAHAYKTQNGNISCFVMPKFIDKHNKLFTVDDVFNGIMTKTSFADIQFFVGKGAGAYPTASAVLSDISALSYDYRYEYKKLNNNDTLNDKEDVLLKVFLRYDSANTFDFKKYFFLLEETYENTNDAYIVGVINLTNLNEIYTYSLKKASIILIETINETVEITEISNELNRLCEIA